MREQSLERDSMYSICLLTYTRFAAIVKNPWFQFQCLFNNQGVWQLFEQVLEIEHMVGREECVEFSELQRLV